MSNDDQDSAESFDEEMLGEESATSDEVGGYDDAPDSPRGIQFADADVTDESFAERTLQEEPELDDDPSVPPRLVEPEILVDTDLLELIDDDGDLAEPDD